jgi:tripartite-type tricarboxylate transporter receptor subunit TctC
MAIASAPSAKAQAPFPTKPVTIVVPYGAGGGVDFFARTIAPKMSERLGQPVVVENKPGAGTAIAATDVARASPDGHRVLIGDISTFATNSTLYKKLSYDPIKDFTPITMTGRMAYLLIVNPNVHPYKNVEDLVAAVRKAPSGSVSYASAGMGGPAHLTGEMFQRAAGIRLNHVPYKGSGPAIPDLLSGQVGMMFMDYAPSRPHLASGKLRALGTGASKPQPELPNTAPIGATYPGFESWFWMGMVAPKGTPPSAIDKLREAYAAAVNDPANRQKLVDSGIEPMLTSTSEMDNYVRSESARMGAIIKEAKIEMD